MMMMMMVLRAKRRKKAADHAANIQTEQYDFLFSSHTEMS